jgi:hypothetical protein
MSMTTKESEKCAAACAEQPHDAPVKAGAPGPMTTDATEHAPSQHQAEYSASPDEQHEHGVTTTEPEGHSKDCELKMDTPDKPLEDLLQSTDTAEEPAPARKTRATATKSRKRKAADLDNSPTADGEAESPPKKQRKKVDSSTEKPRTTTPRAKKTSETTTPKSRRTRKSIKQEDEHTSVSPPRPLPPADVSLPVSRKITQVLDFSRKHGVTTLQRDPENSKLVKIPELNLLGVLMKMRNHWEVGRPEDASIADVGEAIVERLQLPVGSSPESYPSVVIDVSKQTAFEASIHEKIARHGLDDVNLLEIEMELIQGSGTRTSVVEATAKFLLEAVEKGLESDNDVTSPSITGRRAADAHPTAAVDMKEAGVEEETVADDTHRTSPVEMKKSDSALGMTAETLDSLQAVSL